MKKNITVNMFGILYPIDEDAYELLNRYLSNMRGYFSRQDGGTEIADDIEARVAELMNELRQSGVNAVTIEHVQSIISRIGSPEQLDEIDVETTTESGPVPPPYNPPAGPKPEKKLYRDIDHKMLGGVLAGLGCYLGLNPLWLRLAALVIFFCSYGWATLIYIVFWVLIPPAVTPEERLQMKGEPVNFDNLREEFLNGTREMVNRSSAGSFMSGVLQVLCSIFKVLLYVVGIAVLVGCAFTLLAALIGGCGLLLAPWGDMGDLFGHDFPLVIMAKTCSPWTLWIFSISLIVSLALTLYIGAHFILRMAGRITPMSKGLKVTSGIVWLVAVVVLFGSWSRVLHSVSVGIRPHEEQRAEERDAKERAYVTDMGWRIVHDRNVSDNRLTKKGEHYSGNRDRRYFDGYNSDGSMAYEVVCDAKVAPGTYTLEAVARTDGQGCEIFAVNGDRTRYAAAVPVCGNVGGSVWADAKLTLESDTTTSAQHERLKQLAKVNHNKGYGWSTVTVSDIIVGPDSIVTYGVTNQSPTTSWDGSWLSATAFELKKQ
ncbi:MAG: PspC domain-containing protein [Duncaniella sp.]|nr:PspC domain-containing protein [Duncaniella sp.]